MFDIFSIVIFFVSLGFVIFLLLPKKNIAGGESFVSAPARISRMERFMDRLEQTRLYVISFYEKFLRRFSVYVLKVENFLQRKIRSARKEIKETKNGISQNPVLRAASESQKSESTNERISSEKNSLS